MTPKLYMTEVSPPVRAVLLTARVLNITLDLKEVNLNNKEHLSPKFLKLNPQHTVPTLEDNGYIIWDSHAIIAYLVGKYGVDDSLYPRDVHKRAVIDQRLHFDSGVISSILKTIMNHVIYGNPLQVPADFDDQINRTYSLVEAFLDTDGWIAGNFLSIADLSLIPSVTTLNIICPIDCSKYPKIVCWIKRSEEQPFYVANQNGLNKLRGLLRSERRCGELNSVR